VFFATIRRRRRKDSVRRGPPAAPRRYRRVVAYRPRSFLPLAPSHLTARAVDGLGLFPTTADCFAFLALLRRVGERTGWTLATWCLMGTHYHLIVFTPAEPLVSKAMQVLNGVYARELNHRHGRRGHVFGERFTDTLAAGEQHLEASVDYVLDNPVRAGLVGRPQDWPWSGDGTLTPRPLRRLVAPSAWNRNIPVRLGG
jgi:REP element-mobilizing transposase RayT